MYTEAPQCVFTLEDKREIKTAVWKGNKTFGEMKLSRWKKNQLGLNSYLYVGEKNMQLSTKKEV